MAVVSISDIYVPALFAQMEQERQTQTNIFVRSGVVQPSAILQANVVNGGRIIELPNYNPLTLGEPNVSNDNPADFSVPKNIATTKQHARALIKNESWSSMNLANELALHQNGMGDPIEAITNRIGDYWANNSQQVILNSLMGILADNIANDSSDMVITAGTDAVGLPTAAEIVSLTNIVKAKQTLGDKQGQLTQISVHSAVFSTMVIQNQVITIPASATSPRIDFYNGLEVLVDDGLPVTIGANRLLYTCVLSGRGLFGSASGMVDNPSEYFRIPSAGKGAGQDVLWSRRNDYFHPFGFDFTSVAVAGNSATWAELATVTNWNRIWSRKNVPLAYLRVNN